MLPDAPPYMKWDEEVARQLTDHDKRLQHLERLERLRKGGEGARVFNSINLVIPTGVVTVLTFDSERYDTNNIHDLINPSRLTCRTAGIYNITMHVQFALNNIGERHLFFRVNGAIFIAAYEGTEQLTLSAWSRGHTTQYQFVVGDFVEALVFQNTGGNLNINALSQYSPIFMMKM